MFFRKWLTIPRGSLLLLILLWLGIGHYGLDFGKHWDEGKLLISASESVRGGDVLPGWYNYPSVSFDITLGVCYSFFIDQALQSEGKRINQTEFNLRARWIFLLISSLSFFFLFGLGRLLSGSEWTGLLASGFLAGSWQFGYHARYIAPDAILTAFVLGALYFSLRGQESNNKKDWLWAAVFGGLSLGTKYPGGLILIPILLAVILQAGSLKSLKLLREGKLPFKKLGIILVVFFGVFLLTSPGILMEFGTFLKDLKYEMAHYASGHRGHTLKSPLDHLGLMFQFLGLKAGSPFWSLSLVIAVSALGGFFFAWRQKRLGTILCLSFFVPYLLYFSLQHVMIVRNYLVLIPALALFAAVFWVNLGRELHKRKLAWSPIAIGILLLFGVGASIGSQAVKARSIDRGNQPQVMIEEFAEYLENHPSERLFGSPRVVKFWEEFRQDPFPGEKAAGTLENMPEDAIIAFFTLEPKKLLEKYRANRPFYTVRTFGPQAVDFNYYPFWTNNLLVLMPAKYANGLYFNPFGD